MTNVVEFPGERPPGGGGPEGPMLEQRVARVEERIGRIEILLERLEPKIVEAATVRSDLFDLRSKDLAEVRSKLAFLEGRLQAMPTTWQLLAIVLTTWSLGTALVFTLLRLGR